MKKQLLIILIVTMSVAMSVFIGIQVYWIKNSLQLREANFKRSIDDAVNVALLNLETIEIARRTTKGSLELLSHDSSRMQIKPSDQLIGLNADSEGLIMARRPASETETIAMPGKNRILNNPEKSIQGTPPLSISDNFSEGVAVRKQMLLNYLMNQTLSEDGNTDIEKKISVGLIDTLLKMELLSKGIVIGYEFGVFSPDRNKIVLEKTGKFHDELLFKGFSFPLFSGSGISTRDFLLIYFPGQSKYNLQSLWGMMLVSLLLVLAIIAAFSYSVFTIIRQRKLSELKNDFINNMTHEFKTPISTISLACEALNDQDINQSALLMHNYIGIINEENKRLGKMAEKILQTAILDKAQLKIKQENVDIHRVIEDVLKSMSIVFESRNGTIEKRLDATNFIVLGDKVHLTNVIYNLLDNANKYTPNKPKIEIITQNKNEHNLVILIKDNGIGINRSNQKKIFEKLYRVPTGNRHDVKGFGLGLSYVQVIVEIHGGNITVDSELKKGSVFKINLPLKK